MSGKHGDDEITILEKEEILKEDETHSLVEAMKEEEIPIDQQDTIPVSEEKLNDNNLVIQHSMNYEHHHHHHHHHHDTDLNNEEGDKQQH
ncbi:hypothetical protein TRFO_34952 [Tritrichomonas foetus]|uniref:Uncharacterized protein n=1 Tax=Tritrichomonas foetus TaxID=1144522 RepID=A0A1J4JHK8_9EUKA|nr:hypothetical protein TRFO_34952 [Tritrichomonas foetus]|eukprot:OHS98622.1 hypothetical protein TRFO_34952 [Tritrichomonas foetus]